MARVRPGGAKRWKQNAGLATEAYVTGIENPRKDWATATADAEENWMLAVQEAANDKRFGKGVRNAGSDKWRQKATTLGASRFAQGVQAAEIAYEAGVKPYLDVIEAVVLPPRFPKGDPRNLERVKAICIALRKKKTGG